MYADLDQKICTKCKQSKNPESFTKDCNRKDGLFPWCKTCKKTLDQAGYLKNSAKIKAATKAWKHKNLERKRELNRQYKKRNKDLVNKNTAKFKVRNKGVTNANTAKRRAALLHRTPKWLTEADIKAIRALYEKAAEMTLQTGTRYVVDHDIPLQGEQVSGLHVPGNLRIILEKDNLAKKNKYKI